MPGRAASLMVAIGGDLGVLGAQLLHAGLAGGGVVGAADVDTR